MADFHFIGHSGAFRQYLVDALAALGHTEVSQARDAQVILVSPLEEDAFAHDVNGRDGIGNWIHALPQAGYHPEKLIFLSSSKVYGWGKYACGDCGPVADATRPEAQLTARRWEVLCPICGEMMMPQPFLESDPLQPLHPVGQQLALYEEALQANREHLDYPVIVLRLFSVYWPRPAFFQQKAGGNVVAQFTRDLLSGVSPTLYEDGLQMRDFTHGQDVVQALERVIQAPHLPHTSLNIASGQCFTVQELAAHLQETLGKTDIPYHMAETYRLGDERHCLADITKARHLLGYTPQFADTAAGLQDYAHHLAGQILSPSGQAD